MDYPDAPRLDLVEEVHGRAVADPYRWLEDPDDPATRAWSTAQDRLCRARLDALPGRERVRERVATLLGAGMVSVPVWRGDRAFFLRREPRDEHPVLFAGEPDGQERPLLDPMALDPSGRTTLDAWEPSPDGRLLACQLSSGGDEESALRVLDVATGEVVDGPIDRTRYSPVAWLPGGRAFYYVRRLPPGEVPPGEEQYHRRVWLHRLGADPATDALVFGAGLDKTNYYGVSVSRDGRWLVVGAAAGTAPRNDLWIADLAGGDPAAPALRPVQVGVDAQTAGQVEPDGRLYLFTDRDAPRGRICVTDPADPAYERWRDLLPEDAEAVVDGYAVTSGAVVVNRTRHAVGEIVVLDRETGAVRDRPALPRLGTVTGLAARPEGGHDVWFGYTDFVTPHRVLLLDARSGAVSLWADAPGTVSVPPVDARLVDYRSADGTVVRMFVLAPPGAARDGRRPTVLTGYGGFGVPMEPAYSATVNAWLEAGGVYAIACLRGGAEEGEAWHRAGMREHKQRVFDDFHAAADWLVGSGHTSPEHLGISGGSNGGLLVGAALTQRPEAYRAVVCSAPLLDMVRYERFGLGATWSDEFGTAADPEELGWLLGYSPYHHVRAGTAYPAVLFTVFDGDTRVDPLHARKTCAALQWATASGRPVLLRREADVGHGARALSRSIDLTVDTTAFLAAELGLDLGPGPGPGPGLGAGLDPGREPRAE